MFLFLPMLSPKPRCRRWTPDCAGGQDAPGPPRPDQEKLPLTARSVVSYPSVIEERVARA